MNRRNFIHKFGGLTGATAMANFLGPQLSQRLDLALKRVAHQPDEVTAVDEKFWQEIRLAFSTSSTMINLNNGGVSPQPIVVQEAVERYNKMSNEVPTYYMWRLLEYGRNSVRRELAHLAGCSPEEVAINRNATEGLDTIIFGLRLRPGDEVVLSKQDYPNTINAWKQRAHRDGIVLKWLDFKFPIEDKAEIVRRFEEAFSPRTKLVQITHVINWIGQIMPVNEIAKKAQERGIEVMVDAAHSFAQLDFRIDEMSCDYLGTSLHKWLCAPFGTGMLYVRRDKIKNLYPLIAAPDPEDDNIRKFENLGTRSIAIEQAIGQAINFHSMIGIKRKQQRLYYLKNYWAEKIKNLPGVQIHTSLKKEFGCAIGMFSVDGKKSADVAKYLQKKHHIHTVSIEWENIDGVRVTPNVYTLTRELDVFVAAIEKALGGDLE
ncbi:MAG: aminotransferase class V-fold PLP-dependent enzyme [Bacteroidota bacterium]